MTLNAAAIKQVATPSGTIKQPHWEAPQFTRIPLKIYNSLTKKKEDFVVKGNRVGWYSCGPTVYDASHMGHARAYMTFDIIRRIMTEYFGYNIYYIMNITDIDDKIIIAARHQHLFKEYKNINQIFDKKVLEEVKTALSAYTLSKLGFEDLSLVDSSSKTDNSTDPKRELYMKQANRAKAALDSAVIGENSETVLNECKDVLSTYLDKLYGASVTSPVLFRDFAAHWESEYFKDMDALNIKRPDVLTRVSEYVPEIVKSVETIIANGYAYEVDGSVYFNTIKFDQDPEHTYAKLEPWSANDVKKLQEGEGDLTANENGKRNKADFALWKGSKPGEPAWDSPWGPGRPGWHIECSAMASEVLGSNMDIHSGGIDLAFPHHDNELAQSEALHKCHQWVNYFMHAGHLHIEGQKMSKSLKNFVTIQEALKRYTANQIRTMFLLHAWDSVLDFKEASMNEAIDFETRVNNFMATAKAIKRAQVYVFDGNHYFDGAEKEVVSMFHEKQEKVHEALSDSFNTPLAMAELRDLLSIANSYLSKNKSKPSVYVLDMVTGYVNRMLTLFGIKHDALKTSENDEEVLMPVLNVLSGFRDMVRKLAQAKADPMEILRLCDKMRDVDLVELGVVLDDQADGVALVKLMDKDSIVRQREEKKSREMAKQQEKQDRINAELVKKMDKIKKGKILPSELFKDDESKNLFSQWDECGIPTHDVEGAELAKSRRKKLQKEFDQQVKLNQEYEAYVKENGPFQVVSKK